MTCRIDCFPPSLKKLEQPYFYAWPRESPFRTIREPEGDSTDYQYLLKRLRAARRQAGLTQVQVAKALGRPQSFVTKCELGERRIDPVDLQRFANLYRKPLSFFLPRKRDQK